jgi:hypothetical protein
MIDDWAIDVRARAMQDVRGQKKKNLTTRFSCATLHTFGTRDWEPTVPQPRRDEILHAASTELMPTVHDSTNVILYTRLQTNPAIERLLLKGRIKFPLLGVDPLVFSVKLELLQNGLLQIVTRGRRFSTAIR